MVQFIISSQKQISGVASYLTTAAPLVKSRPIITGLNGCSEAKVTDRFKDILMVNFKMKAL